MADIKTAPSYRAGPAWMARGSRFATPQTLYPNDPACQPCPDCGGLECLCRPRFFAGQLLTEQDLNRLDAYIKAKNQLHNRYLFGSGVVCGLEVRCHPCGDVVTVTPGYALSPCGDDIVVCKADPVDICSLINKCRATTMPDCRPYSGDSTNCQDLVEDWILAIRYEERPSRGITALTSAGPVCCACGKVNCTSNGSGACGCAGVTQQSGCWDGTMTATQPATTTQLLRTAPPACEPTLTCEGYRYEVFLAPTKQDASRTSLPGELYQRFLCCAQDLIARTPNFQGTLFPFKWTGTQAEASNWCCTVKQALVDHFVQIGGYDCEAVLKLQMVVCPSPNSSNFDQAFEAAVFSLLLIGAEEYIDCFCSATLPPCRGPGDPRVPLASVSVRRSDCTIVSICNWTPERKHVLTFPTLSYWLGWLGLGTSIHAAMHYICCELLAALGNQLPQGGQDNPIATPLMNEAAPVPTRTMSIMGQPVAINLFREAPTGAAATVGQAVLQNLLSPASTIHVGDLATAVFTPLSLSTGSQRPEDVQRLAAHPAVKALAETLRPLAAGLMSGLSGGTAAPGPPPPASPPSPAPAAAVDLEELRTRLTQLQETVVEQQAQIDRLRSPPAPTGKKK